MVAKYYVVHEREEIIYVTDNKQDAIKTAVEWFFGIEANPFSYYGRSGVKSFDKGKLHCDPPRYGDEVFQFGFMHAEKILNLYKGVSEADPEIIDVLQKLIASKEASRSKAEEVAKLEQQIRALQSRTSSLNDEIMTTFVNPLVDASEGAQRFIDKMKTNSREAEEREYRRLQELAKSGKAVFGLNKTLDISFVEAESQREEGDDDDKCECIVCKAKDGHMYFVTLTAEKDDCDEDYDRKVDTMAYLCCDCFADNLTDILKETLVLKSVRNSY